MYSVLIVEDEYLQTEAMKSMINSRIENVKVVATAENGEEAVEKFKKFNPDIVLMDIQIPKINGLEASKLIKEINRNVSIIILTAHSEFEYARKAIKIDVDDYILKPARPEKVIEVINNSIRKLDESQHIINHKLYNKSNFKTNYLTGDYASAKDDLYEILKFSNFEFKDIHDLKDYIIETIDETVKNYSIKEDEEFEKYYIKIKNSRDISNLLKSLLNISQYIYREILNFKNMGAKDELDLSIQYMELNLHKKIGLKDVAGYIHISPTYYSRLFKENMGEKFIDYLIKRRIKTSKLLLEYTNLSIYEIAEMVGFNESNYFSRVFKENTGLSPTDYRTEKS